MIQFIRDDTANQENKNNSEALEASLFLFGCYAYFHSIDVASTPLNTNKTPLPERSRSDIYLCRRVTTTYSDVVPMRNLPPQIPNPDET